jgi:hypothetical protein
MKELRQKLIATESFSTLVAVSDKKNTKNSKMQTIRKLLEQKGDKLTLLWVSSQVRILGDVEMDNAANESLDENLGITKEYPCRSLVK